MKLIRRTNALYIRKRVPRRYQAVEERDWLWISLHTDSEDIARQKAPKVWADMLEAWEAKLDGATALAEERMDAARNLAARRGYRYLPAAEVARLPTSDLVERMERVRTPSGKIDTLEADALLGIVPAPTINITRAMALYWDLAADKRRGKSTDQIRRWENPIKKAVKNFIAVIGDKDLGQITGDDMLDFRQWWVEKIEAEDLTPNSANKDLGHLSLVLRTVNKMKRLGLNLPLSDLSLREGEKKQRPAFSTGWIKEKILAPGALDGLNTEARCILLGMINTGYRPSEAACMTAAQIHLDATVPHISIEPVGRTLKSQYSRRKIPLAGVSLEAFKQCPNGFPRYADNPGLSATVNKFLRENGLVESPEHTMYGFRHAFEDRMLAANVDERIRRDLFGHTLNRERYGNGASMEQLLEVIEKIAL